MWLRPGGDHCDHELAVEVWGATLILGLLFVSGRDHCDHELAVEVRPEHSDPVLAVRDCSGPAGTSAIMSLQLGSGGDHSDPGLAVRVRREEAAAGGGGARPDS